MSNINKNVTITDQYYSTAKGPLDAKQTPADSYNELLDINRIPTSQRYVGLTVTVLNSGSPIEYWLVGGRSNTSWKVKTGNIVPTKSDLLLISSSACTVGLEMIVQVDESNENKLTKYWVKEINSGVVTWERKDTEIVEIKNEIGDTTYSGETLTNAIANLQNVLLITGDDVD